MSVSKKFTVPSLFFAPPIQGEKLHSRKSPRAGSRISEEKSLKKNKSELGLIGKNRVKFRGVTLFLFFLSFFFFFTTREKLSAGIHLGPSSSREKSRRVSVGVVTGCHAGSLEGQRHPEELSQLVGHLPTSYGGGLLAVVFAIHL